MNGMLNVLPGKSSSTQGGRVHPDLEALLALQDKDVAVSGCDARLKALEPELRALHEQRRQRLEWVRGAREASTLMAELDLARTVLAKEEAEFMRSGDAVGEAERKTAEAENALQNVRDAQAASREALAGRRQEIAAERESAVVERDRTSKTVNPALLVRYDKIRRGKAPLAIYPLHGSSCGNCFTAVPTQRKALIQRDRK